MRQARLYALFVLLLVSGCAGASESGSHGDLEVERTYVGDTLVVRTVAGSAWDGQARLVPEVAIGELDGELEYLFGSIRSLAVADDGTVYVVDSQVPELRVYDAEGVFRKVLGRPGEGPGEIKQPDGGLAVLSDGRVLVRDPGNGRIQVYSPAGDPLATWPIRGGFNTSTPFHQTWADEVHAVILLDPEADVRDWRTGLVRFGPDGVPGDTLVPPDFGYEAATVEARREGGASVTSVPFSPREAWTLHPEGYFVHGLSTRYRVDLFKPSGVLRIEREHEPVPVSGGEKREEEARVTRNMRYTDPDWRWNGAAIPDVKPPFQGLFVGQDGRIWVQVHQPALEVEDPDYDPTDPTSVEDRWREPVAFDVFGGDGTYEGRVRTDRGFRLYPTPVFGDTHVWATTRDDLDVQRVVRFRIEVEGAATGS
jgi:hypothetical protein